jgi:hypothetical protein
MTLDTMAGLLEKRREALVEYCIGQVGKGDVPKYDFLRTPADLFELLRMDPLDTYAVQSSWVAEATSCAQQFIHAAYRKLEPGYADIPFDKSHLAQWELYNNRPDWVAVKLLESYPENYINPYSRLRKTSLFKTLENNLNQARLTLDSVQAALQDYLKTFEQTCNLDVISGYMDGASPLYADYYFVGRQRVPPFQYFWRKVEVDLDKESEAINPAAWSEWQPVDIPTGRVLDMRPVFWGGRLCLVWAEWRDKVDLQNESFSPHQLTIQIAFKAQNGTWSAPLNLHTSTHTTDKSNGLRLLASVWTDYLFPKGKLGILAINEQSGGNELEVFVAWDVLFGRLVGDDGVWLKDPLSRFISVNTVQNPLGMDLEVVRTEAPKGKLTPYLDVHLQAYREGVQDVLVAQGFCRPTGLTGGDVELELVLQNAAGTDPALKEKFALKGGWSTRPLKFTRGQGSWSKPSILFGEILGGVNGCLKLDLTITDLPTWPAPRLHKNTENAAQFLDFNQQELTLKFVRLNSLFGPELVQRSNISVDDVLDWDNQFLAEPPPEGFTISERTGGFNSANGLIFWELFLHVPLLVAARLNAEDRFLEAQKWLHYLFDPQAPRVHESNETPNAKPAYWRCRPLDEAGDIGFETQNVVDPDAIGYGTPLHFRILIFTEYVRNLVAWGDWYYRQLTRESIAAAKLCYVQAEFLMGPAPLIRTTNRWQTTTIKDLLEKSRSRPALEAFEQSLAFSLTDFPSSADVAPELGLLANKPFVCPINEQLLALYDLPTQRLHNLRSNLTLDGKPLDIPLFSPPTDPNQLLRDLASGGIGGPRPMGGRLVVGAFRWRVTYEVALRAVQILQEHGSQVLRLLEQRDRAEQEELQQNHLVELGAYARSVQEQTIEQLQASVAALTQSRALAQERATAYDERYVEHISAVEYEVMESLHQSRTMSLVSSSLMPGSAAVAAIPNIFGMAGGGHRAEKIIDAVSFGLGVAASVWQIDADKQATTEGYRRRREDWQLQRDQARAEVLAINEQINAQNLAVAAARTSLTQTVTANNQALTVYNFLKKRSGNAELFGWLLGQFKALHYQAYDAVVSLCLSAQACLSAETGDYETQIPMPQVWLDNRYGLTAGEHLRGYLLRLEREYLQRHERRLELVKTVSLRQLFADTLEPQPGYTNWSAALAQLLEQGTLEFSLTQLLFDRDHPGHYCRQINSIEVDLPVLVGPYQDVRATLVQISSMTATKASAASVSYLHRPVGNLAPADVQINLRSGQQIALSLGMADNGLSALKPDEGLLNPFENTGAVSRWRLHCPWPGKEPQKSLLASLTDIILRIRYTAKGGEPVFVRSVEDLVTRFETEALNTRAKGAGSHE